MSTNKQLEEKFYGKGSLAAPLYEDLERILSLHQNRSGKKVEFKIPFRKPCNNIIEEFNSLIIGQKSRLERIETKTREAYFFNEEKAKETVNQIENMVLEIEKTLSIDLKIRLKRNN